MEIVIFAHDQHMLHDFSLAVILVYWSIGVLKVLIFQLKVYSMLI